MQRGVKRQLSPVRERQSAVFGFAPKRNVTRQRLDLNCGRTDYFFGFACFTADFVAPFFALLPR